MAEEQARNERAEQFAVAGAMGQGQEEANAEVERVNKIADPAQKEQELETLVKKLLGSSTDGMGLEDIAKLSSEDLEAMLQNKKRSQENKKRIARAMAKILTGFGKTNSEGKLVILDKLGKLLSTDPERLKRELKDVPKEKRDEILAIFTAFVPLALTKAHPDNLVAYAKFIWNLFKDMNYLSLNEGKAPERTRFEEDLEKFGQINPQIVHGVLKETLMKALDKLHEKDKDATVCGQVNKAHIEERIDAIVKPSTESIDITADEEGQKLSLPQMLKIKESIQTNSFEAQRVAKLHNDIGQTLMATVDGLFDDGKETTVLAGTEVTRTGLLDDIVRFEGGADAPRWATMNILLEEHLAELEQQPRTGSNGKRISERIGKVKTLISARNAFDLVRHSGNITQQFLPFYERHFLYEIARVKAPPGTRPDITTCKLDDYATLPEDQKQLVASRTAQRVRQSVTFTVSNIYRNYLSMSEEPTEDYHQALQHGGDSISNPTEMFQQLTRMISNLAYQATTIDSGKLDFTVSALGGVQTMYDPNIGRETSTHSSHRIQKRGKSPNEFLKEILAEVKADNGFFEAGHQYRYVTNMGSPDSQRRFFQSVGDLLRNSMTARNIDRIYSMEDSTYISRTASFIETILKKRMGEKGWINEGDSKLFQEIFLNKGEGGKSLVLQVQEFLRDNYPDIPTWQRQRILQHSFTIVFAGRFRYQQIFSYTNASPGYQGQAEDKQMFNGVFAPFQKSFRFAYDKWDHDFWLRGAYWQPIKNIVGFNQEGSWDPFEVGKEGHGVYLAGYHETQGRMAWDLTEHFQDDVPEAFAPVNRLKAGGYDTLRGWRRMADMGVIDKRLYSIKAVGGQPTFLSKYKEGGVDKYDGISRLWKSVENIGVNDVQAFVDTDILPMFGYTAEGEFSNPEAYSDFIGHIYDRYLNDENEFGKHLTHNYLFDGVNKAIKTLADPIKAAPFNTHMYGHDAQRASSKDEFMQLFQARATQIFDETPKTSKDEGYNPAKEAAKSLRSDVVKPMLYDAMLVMVAERSPLEFLYRLRNQDEQNGLRLDTQIKDKYFASGSDFMNSVTATAELDDKMKRKLTSDDPDGARLVKDQIWDEVTDDIAFIQGELRGEIDEEILGKRKEWETATGGLNIYGANWNERRSAVNGGLGYVLDDTTVIRIMLKKNNPALAKQIQEGSLSAKDALNQLLTSTEEGTRKLGLRVERAVRLRNDIISEMGKEPDVKVGDKKDTEITLLEKYFDKEGEAYVGIKSGLSKEDRVKAERLLMNRNKRVNRARWMRRMWDEGYLGSIPFMADNSEVHKVFLNADDTMVYRSTGECGVAEHYKLILDARAPEGVDTNMLLMLKDAARKGTQAEWGKLKSLITGFRKECSDEIGDSAIFMPVVLGLVKLQLSGLSNKQEVRHALGKWKSWFKKEGQSLFSDAYTNFEHHGFEAITIRQYLLSFCKVNGINPESMEDFANMFGASWIHVGREIIPEYLSYIMAFAFVAYATKAINEAQKK